MFSNNKCTRSIAAAAAAIAVAVGGFAVINSNSGSGTAGTATAAQPGIPAKGSGGAWAPAGAGTFGKTPTAWSEGTGTIITGAAADKAKAAAIAANYTGIVNRVLELSDGSYVVHLIGTRGVHHVFVDTTFKVVAAV
jgi:hypothetical protein